MKHARPDASYPNYKHERKPVSNLKSIDSVGFEQKLTKFIEILALKDKFFTGKKS